jgi:hypothetical protein
MLIDNLNDCTFYSGGAKGADTLWMDCLLNAGLDPKNFKAYYVEGFPTPAGNTPIPAVEATMVADDLIKTVNKKYLNRKFPTKNKYANSLIRRNYYQVTKAERVIAVGVFDFDGVISGGTAWACYMAIEAGTGVFVYDQNQRLTFTWDFGDRRFVRYNDPVYLATKTALIGSRDLNKNGREFIETTIKISINEPN